MSIPKKTFEIFVKTIRKYINAGAKTRLWNFINKLRAEDIAHLFERLIPENKKVIFEILKEKDLTKISKVLSELEPEDTTELLADESVENIAKILNYFQSDDAVKILYKFPEDIRTKIINQMDKDESEDVKALLRYEEDTAGRIMSTDFYALNENTRVNDAITAIQLAADVEIPFYLYVIDKDKRLVGVVSLKKLLLFPPQRTLKSIMLKDVIYVNTRSDQEEVAKLVARYDLVSIPVVDDNKQLEGVITVDDIIDVIREEATEDIYKMAAVAEEERSQDPIHKSLKNRLPWLMLALLTTFFSAIVITMFEGIIKNAVILAALMPLVAALGGIAGNQTNAVVVRELAIKEFDLKIARRLLLKHFSLGILLGIIVGTGGAFLINIAYSIIGKPIHLSIILLFGVAIFINILNGLFMGTLIPISFKTTGIDPALSSNMFVTMFTDTFGFFIFLQLAKTFYHI